MLPRHMTRAQRFSAGIALGVFCLALVGGALKPGGPASAVLGNALWFSLGFLGLFLAYGMRPLSALTELGLRGSPTDGLTLALLCSAPMVVTFVLTSRFNSHISWTHLLLVAAVAPAAEEVVGAEAPSSRVTGGSNTVRATGDVLPVGGIVVFEAAAVSAAWP